MATVTGRVGYAWANNLIYAKGGYAGVHSRLAVSDTVPAFTGAGSATAWHNGWTIGAGWEYGVTQNWIVGLEYDYAAFQTKNYQLAGADNTLAVYVRRQAARYPVHRRPRQLQVRRAGDCAILTCNTSSAKAPAVAGAFSLPA